MKFNTSVVVAIAAAFSSTAQAVNAGEVLLESFEDPSHHWFQMNDPVMGGKSTGTFSIEDGLGVFDGEVVDVPFLKAPGFIKVQSRDLFHGYPDVSSCQGIKLSVKSSVSYEGYRVGFGNAHPPDAHTFAYGYKSNMKVPKGDHFVDVEIPFHAFSDLWDDATGDQIKTCHDCPEYCPDQRTLQNMKTISVWAEGVAGKVHLEIKTISATGCTEVEQESTF